MSTLPSRPIYFTSEIGVMGFGKCKPELKCPPHTHQIFPAYFYELTEDESPTTPYVGNIELESEYRIPPKGQIQIVSLQLSLYLANVLKDDSKPVKSSREDFLDSL